MDLATLGRWRRYFRENFVGPFEEGWGTEDVMRLLATHSRGRSWLDLGSGPTTLFWSMFVPPMEQIWALDQSPEALRVLRDFASAQSAPLGYIQAGERYGRSADHLLLQRRALRRFLPRDVFGPWHRTLGPIRFDLITAFGILSLSGSPARLGNTLRYARAALSDGGILIGASWILSPAHARRRGIDNGFLTKTLMTRLVRDAGLRLVAAETAWPRDRRLYVRIEMFVAQRT